MVETADATARAAATRPSARPSSLDIPGVLPIMLVAATWEFLLNRVVSVAAQDAPEGTLGLLLRALFTIGTFSENLAFLLGLALFAEAVIMLMRPEVGPIPHRITVCGFAVTVLVTSIMGWTVPVSGDTALLAQSAAVLLSLLVTLTLSWHRVRARFLLGAALLLLPTLLRFAASCAISLPLLRTEAPVALIVYRGAEVAAIVAALASPWLLAGLTPRRLVQQQPLIVMGLASVPTFAFVAALVGPGDHARELCLSCLGFELIVPPVPVVYPLALFSYLLAVALLLVPGPGATARSVGAQRIGYGLVLLFLAGLDGLWGTVAGLQVETVDLPELIPFLLDGNWSRLTTEYAALIGPPVRDVYQLLLLSYGTVLVVRGILAQAGEVERP
jgi:hypothetical protein